MSSDGASWKDWLLHLAILTFFERVDAGLTLLTMNGVGSLTGYPGLVYQAIRYEPLCGSLGTGDFYTNPHTLTDRCTPAIESFGNNTEDTVALYDITGSRLKDARVGGGYDVCLCFALSQTGDGIKGAMCVWVDGSGRSDIWWSLLLDNIVAGSYRPNVAKALPLCKDVDVSSLKAKWSSTAIHPSYTEKTVNAPGGPPETKTVLSTFIPSVVGYTELLTLTTTDPNGSRTIQTITKTSQAAVVTVTEDKKEMDRGDIIALGVGLGVGIPTIILMLIGLCIQCYRRRR
jgi:hypothetical protein